MQSRSAEIGSAQAIEALGRTPVSGIRLLDEMYRETLQGKTAFPVRTHAVRFLEKHGFVSISRDIGGSAFATLTPWGYFAANLLQSDLLPRGLIHKRLRALNTLDNEQPQSDQSADQQKPEGSTKEPDLSSQAKEPVA
ncbi:hypothetical protein Rhe02_97980 [Rhizocola hellebori]|uniref:Uncharacterized protein n=2 Tax=Rhizocola hellebori TaxID=1392758 RepID=A0A8J3QJJ0_9ACTN|nr:hypothetical protein Rhe02_97980 [Rhizocola hellebori]